MAYEISNYTLKITLVAGADLSAAQYKFVKISQRQSNCLLRLLLTFQSAFFRTAQSQVEKPPLQARLMRRLLELTQRNTQSEW
jgi:hypothetical protein